MSCLGVINAKTAKGNCQRPDLSGAVRNCTSLILVINRGDSS
ncbi:hypothetical protein KPSA3_03935 [Pseudomonas syringae pv. actinidiae]|uniref:Uncharacterized protein n=1 Tax=Pseudomonas syringae pv. actinidiae TaxID=103796 RepID=A0AAN4TLK6_PSESF|nr:hypothetical protein KPSA3_03935 [Pseudomonas syringae pv. actinidiae]